jgi:hypothetical protein
LPTILAFEFRARIAPWKDGIHALLKAIGRLLVMGLVMVVVITTSMYAGFAATVSVALAVVGAGVVGMAGAVRRRVPKPVVEVEAREVAAMAPETLADADPESLMPRWRRPSLLAARHADPLRAEATERTPTRFRPDHAPTPAELRVVRYAVVPLLDRPDEVLGLQLFDLVAGDEVRVVESSGAFWEIVCANGEQGWVHRTTLGLPSTIHREPPEERSYSSEADDALTALLTARGLN